MTTLSAAPGAGDLVIGVAMLQFAILTFGLLASFVLFSAEGNQRAGRAHPPILVYVGYLLCGLSAGAALALPTAAVMGVRVDALLA